MARPSKSKPLQLSPGSGLQIAALCWREVEGETQVLLITSRDTGRWILPKGWPMKGRSLGDAAQIEAWEEAGVTGTVSPLPIGSYTYQKQSNRVPGTLLTLDVQVYAVMVEDMARKYPEVGQRRRKWFRPEKAARKVDEEGLAALLRDFARPDEASLPPAAQSASA